MRLWFALLLGGFVVGCSSADAPAPNDDLTPAPSPVAMDGGGDAAPPSSAIRLMRGIQAPADMTVGAGNVFWLEAPGIVPSSGAVRSCAVRGCAETPTIVANQQDNPHHVALGATRLFWTTASYPESCALTGCSTESWVSLGGQANAYDVHSDATHVFFVDMKTWALRSCPIGGCATATTVVDLKPEFAPVSFALHDTRIYWTAPNLGKVFACPKTGCATPTSLATLQDRPNSIATDDLNLYWASDTPNGAISTMPLAGGKPRVLTTARFPSSLITRGIELYWRATDGVFRCNVANCAPERVLEDDARMFAVDDSTIYWIDASGSLWKRPL